MRNDTTRLIFRFAEGADEELELAAVDAVVRAIQGLFSDIAPYLGSEIEARMACIASPRSGSIEFNFSISFRTVPEKRKRHKSDVRVKPTATLPDKIMATSAAGALIWLVLFGENGVVDLMNRPPPPKSAPTIEEVLSETIQGLGLEKTRKTNVTTRAAPGLIRIIEAARDSGADRVEIQLPGEPMFPLYEFTTWEEFLSGRHQSPRRNAVVKALRTTTVVYHGRTMTGVLAKVPDYHQTALFLWPPIAPVPERGEEVSIYFIEEPGGFYEAFEPTHDLIKVWSMVGLVEKRRR